MGCCGELAGSDASKLRIIEPGVRRLRQQGKLLAVRCCVPLCLACVTRAFADEERCLWRGRWRGLGGRQAGRLQGAHRCGAQLKKLDAVKSDVRLLKDADAATKMVAAHTRRAASGGEGGVLQPQAIVLPFKPNGSSCYATHLPMGET